MRPVLHGDVVAVARALVLMDDAHRAGLVRALIERADTADEYRKRAGRLHPLWGDGSLEMAANRHPKLPEPGLDDQEYCRSMMITFEELLKWRMGQDKVGRA